MNEHNHNIAALIGARICHDLISPIGAVANGLELMALSQGTAAGAEMSLVSQSADSANARIRMFRLAFGPGEDGTDIACDDLAGILHAVHAQHRIAVDWQAGGRVSRRIAQCLLLAVLCAETALPRGGGLAVRNCNAASDGTGWQIAARSAHLAADPELWSALEGTPPVALDPAQVQFAILPQLLKEDGRRCTYEISADTLRLTL